MVTTKLLRLSILKMERDKLLRILWSVYRLMSDIQETNMSEEDLELWTLVTNHSSFQSKLSEK